MISNSKISLLFIISDLSRGGAQSVLYNLVSNLPSGKYAVSIISLGENMTMAEDFKALECAVYFFSNVNLKSKFSSFKALLSEISPSIVHCHVAFASTLVFLYLRLCGIRNCINTIHRFDPSMKRPRVVIESYAWLFLKKQISISQFSERLYRKMFFTPKCRSLVIRNGIDIDKFTPNGETYDFGEGFHVVSVANLHLKKGYETAVQAFGKITAEHPEIHYHIIGAPVPGNGVAEWIDEFIESRSLQNNIHLHGMKSDVRPYLRGADLFLTPSEQEILPMSILEAISCGTPTVSTAVGAIPEIFAHDRESAVLFKPFSIDALADAVMSVYNSPEKCRVMRAKNAVSAELFTAKKMAEEYELVYKSLLKQF